MIPRRSLLQTAVAGAAAVLGASHLPGLRTQAATPASTPAAPDLFQLGMAGYSLHKFALEPALEILRKVDVHHLCIKDFHLPLTSNPEQIGTFHAQLARAGVTGYGVGPIYMGSEEEVIRAFDYTRRVGVRLLVGVPFRKDGQKRVASAELLRLIHDKVREHDILYAIHNHGPDMPELFPTAESAMELIHGMDRRVGLCLDIGHQFRDGKDPVRALTEYADRIHDIHIKNVTAPDKSGRGIEMPRGAIDFPAFVRALRKTRYAGVCGLEYEKDMDNPLTGIAESIGYFRGVMDATR